MFKFEYEIEINDKGRPFINPVKDTSNEMSFVEHKFMALEISRSVISSTINLHENNPEKHPLSISELNRLIFIESELTRLSDIFSNTIKEQFELVNMADQIANKNFNMSVLTIEERDLLNYNGIIYNDELFKRVEGLKVKVIQTGQIFELKGGIDNDHWTQIN